jgi:hypothetical protein
MACHHWISVTAKAGDAANASDTTPAAAAVNPRKAIKPPPIDRPLGALSVVNDAQMTL